MVFDAVAAHVGVAHADIERRGQGRPLGLPEGVRRRRDRASNTRLGMPGFSAKPRAVACLTRAAGRIEPAYVHSHRTHPDPPRRNRLEPRAALPGPHRRARSTTWVTSRRAASGCAWPARPVQQLISSDLMRAQQTAAPAARAARARDPHHGGAARAALRRRRRHARRRDPGAASARLGRLAEVPARTTRCPRASRRASSTPASSRRWAASPTAHDGADGCWWSRTAACSTWSGAPRAGWASTGRARATFPMPASTASASPMRRSPTQIEIVDWADTRHLADLPAQPTYDQQRHLAY